MKNLINLDNFKEKDLYSIILYAIYKNTQDPRYSTLSELIYTLDKNSLLNFCSIFGGITITVPTLDQLNLYTNTLLLYQKVANGWSISEAMKSLDIDQKDKEKILDLFFIIKDSVNEYFGNNT